MKCKRRDCSNPAAINQSYCCRNCSPYGNYLGTTQLKAEQKRLGRRTIKFEQTCKKLQQLAAEGKTYVEASSEISLSIDTIKVYARKLGLTFKRKQVRGAPVKL